MLQNRVTELQRENDEHRNDLMVCRPVAQQFVIVLMRAFVQGRDGDASRMRELEQQVQTHREVSCEETSLSEL